MFVQAAGMISEYAQVVDELAAEIKTLEEGPSLPDKPVDQTSDKQPDQPQVEKPR